MNTPFRKNPDGDAPKIHRSAYVDPTATIIGKVTVGRNVFVGPGAVLRADEPGSSITVGDRCNIQDRVIVHALTGTAVKLGRNSSLSHGSIVHGPCVVGAGCFIGFGSVVFKAQLGDKVILGHLAVVENAKVPGGRHVPSRDVVGSDEAARLLPRADAEWRAFSEKVVTVNTNLISGYKTAEV